MDRSAIIALLLGVAAYAYVSDPSFAESFDSTLDIPPTDPNTGETIDPVAQAIQDAVNTSAYWKVNDYPLYATAIATAEQGQGIPPDLLARLLYQESSFDPAVINGSRHPGSTSALGIAQFTKGTAQQFGIDPLNPFQAIPAAGRYLAQNYAKFGSWLDAIGAYYAGPGAFHAYLTNGTALPAGTTDYMADINADVPVA